ncbi:hypothetical protein EV06_0815 [Prochlorococcus sp. MIT 0602]|nr:hypothetical protein EV06_0815 [Prochlorococcus sp. MIT 0602]KGG17227.1 hypothetical protein EV07_0663 [Prochlorococcus sp. MIT 0603]
MFCLKLAIKKIVQNHSRSNFFKKESNRGFGDDPHVIGIEADLQT